jgi:hypothetical protein
LIVHSIVKKRKLGFFFYTKKRDMCVGVEAT